MLIFLISCFSFILVFILLPSPMATETIALKVVESVEAKAKGNKVYSPLDNLPELALESILERLPPLELWRMAGVCSYLRERCTSDDLWRKHMNKKWERVIGSAAYGKWQCHMASNKWRSTFFGYMLSSFWPSKLVGSKHDCSLPIDDSAMALCMSLECGKFLFPAQVYNRESGHRFFLSCYDAELSYNSISDTFLARYSPRGRHTIEENVSWDRLRVAPVDTPPFVLHGSDCLEDLKPEDHVEIQWRRNKDYTYGWWYGVVGHLDSCIRTPGWCHCHDSDTVMLEFNQYPDDSRWRRTTVNRKNHGEVGNEADGFYGGIRILEDEKVISTWKNILFKECHGSVVPPS